MDQSSPWVPQEDGTHLPSPDLMKAVRENPENFPNFVADAVVLTGKTRDEVEAIISNPYGDGGLFSGTVVGPIAKMVTFPDVRRGLAEATGWAAEKLGAEETGQAIRDYGQSINAEFETERDLGENLAEVAGQAAPAVAGGIAAGGVIAGGVVGAGIATLTFSDEDNVANMANDYLDGAVPDFLVIQPEDSQEVATAKHLTSNLVLDLAMAGAGHGIAKLYRLWKGGAATPEAVQQIAAEVGAVPNPAPGAEKAAQKVVQDAARKAVDELPAPVEVEVVRKQAAKDKIIADAATKELGRPIEGGVAPKVIPQDVVQAWRDDVFGATNRTINRSKEVNVERRQHLKEFTEGAGADAYNKHSADVLQAITEDRIDDVVAMVRQGPKTANPNLDFVFRQSVTRATLQRLDDNFQAVIERIREDPSLTTKKAWKDLAADYHAKKLKIAELYREQGSAASYAFLDRKGVKFADDEIKAAQEGEAELYRKLKEEGYNLRSSKTEFVVSRVLSLEEMGFDTLEIMDDLYRMFDEFDAARQGALDNMTRSTVAKMSKAAREELENSFVKMLQDLHSSALLGQPSTAGLEVSSNFLNNLTLPLTQQILAKGNVARAAREYAGYRAAWGRAWDTFWAAYRAGKSVTDDIDVMEGAHSGMLDYAKFAEKGQWGRYWAVRLWKFAADISVGASESQKAWRGMGLAYADGLELALKQGATKPQAKKMALEYANKMFDEKGAFTDAALKLEVSQTSWQSVMDTRYATGRMAQAVDNLRNHRNPTVSMLSRATIPFWRTLVNIGSHSMQSTVPPGIAEMIWLAGKTPIGRKYKFPVKALDDFTGRNGKAAMHRAMGRSRLSYAMMGSAWALMETGQIDITGPSGYRSWDAKSAQMQEYPASSLIIGDHSIDLTRLLPFSAPLLLLGVMKDMDAENAMQMKGGNYVAQDDSAYGLAALYGSALGMVNLAMMSDAASFQGVGNLFEAVQKSISDGDPRGLVTFVEGFGKQFVPGLPRVIGKNQGMFHGDWSQHQAEGFLNETLASAGFHTGYARLDFLGEPVVDWGRGIDPFNMKILKADEPVRAEYVRLNRMGDLGLQLDRPNAIFDAKFWKDLGVQPDAMSWLFREEAPSLTQMKTADGTNAWEKYLDTVYKGTASKDMKASTGRYGDRIDIGDVVILKGENFEAALQRTIESPAYQRLTPDAQVKVWKTIFGTFTKAAKDELKGTLVVDPSLFEGSRYGAPSNAPATLNETVKGAKELAVDVQTSRGSPLDAIFSIK